MKYIIYLYLIVVISSFQKSLTGAPIDSTNYTLTVVYDNIKDESNPELNTGPGYSAFLEFEDKAILFDTGGDFVNLGNNIEKLNLNPEKVEAIFISHNHWDHVYGIPTAMGMTKGKAKVYAPAKSAKSILEQYPRMEIIPVTDKVELYPNVWSNGEMEASYRDIVFTEQSLVIVKSNGLYIITGCSHPGIIKIIENIKSMFSGKEVEFVTGGFHLNQLSEVEVIAISNKMKNLGVKKIAPTHCTGDLAIKVFMKEWGNNFIKMHLGDKYSF